MAAIVTDGAAIAIIAGTIDGGMGGAGMADGTGVATGAITVPNIARAVGPSGVMTIIAIVTSACGSVVERRDAVRRGYCIGGLWRLTGCRAKG